MHKDQLKILLLQIRNLPQVREEEHTSFALFSGLKTSQIDILNVFDTPQFPPTIVTGYDAVFVGGASEASVLEPDNYSFISPSKALLCYCIEQSIPVFASCYGFQLAVCALGGKILRDVNNFEMGTIPITLTHHAKHDPIFTAINNPFMAVSVHQERAIHAPQGCETLAYTHHCCHAFKVTHKPFWAFQFHPEVNKAILVKRLTIFSEKYTQSKTQLQAVLDAAEETPESNQLVANFINYILQNNNKQNSSHHDTTCS